MTIKVECILARKIEEGWEFIFVGVQPSHDYKHQELQGEIVITSTACNCYSPGYTYDLSIDLS